MNDTTTERRALSLYDASAAPAGNLRTAPSGKLMGYAIRFNSLSKDLGGFRERIMPGALDATLATRADVRALVDHDHTKLLGRTSAGTLKIGKDDRGLWFELDLPDTQYARDVRALVDRGDVAGMSFGFRVRPGGERVLREGGATVREVHAMDVQEITVTSIPAYPQTSVSLRVDPAFVRRIAGAPMDTAAARRRLRLFV